MKNDSPDPYSPKVPDLVHALLGGDRFLKHTGCRWLMATSDTLVYKLPKRFNDPTHVVITRVADRLYAVKLVTRRHTGGKPLTRRTYKSMTLAKVTPILETLLDMPLVPQASPPLHLQE